MSVKPSTMSSVAANNFLLPNPPPRLIGDDLNTLLVHAEGVGFSDLHIRTGDAVKARIHGYLRLVIERPLNQSEVEELLNALYGANGAGEVALGRPIDTSYEVRPARGVRYRYRVNAKSCTAQGHHGIKITIRSIPTTPPLLDDLGVEPEIWAAFAPPQGMVLVTGPTGSGKSTLLAAGIRKLAEDPDAHRVITTYEAPIEFVYDAVQSPTTMISQCEVPRDVKTFAAGLRNAMREDPDVILVGEARDQETIEAATIASMTGHLVYSTVHSRGVAETVRRMFSQLDSESGVSQADILDALRLVVSQRLVHDTRGKRVALREYLVFDAEIRERLLKTAQDRLVSTVRDLVRERGQTLLADAEKKFTEGRIDQHEVDLILAGT